MALVRGLTKGLTRGLVKGLIPSDGDFSPADLPSFVLWLDASDTSTITDSSGFVSQWDDKSGEGNNVVQATGADQPFTGATSQNGLNALLFNNDYLEKTSFDISINFSVFVLCNVTGANNTFDSIFSVESGGAADFQLDAGTPPTGEYGFRGRGGFTEIPATGPYDDAYYAFAAVFNAADDTVTLYVDGSQVGQATDYTGAAELGTPTHLRIFTNRSATNPPAGVVGEVLAYNAALTPAQVTQVSNYLETKWGI